MYGNMHDGNIKIFMMHKSASFNWCAIQVLHMMSHLPSFQKIGMDNAESLMVEAFEASKACEVQADHVLLPTCR